MKPSYIILFLVAFISNLSIAQIVVSNSPKQTSNSCPLMEVTIQNSEIDPSFYSISYCNHGNAIAVGAYVDLEVPANLSITKSTLPVLSKNGNIYRFDLGDVADAECANLYLTIPNSEQVSNCIVASIHPDNPCQAMIDRYIANNIDDNSSSNQNSTAINTTGQRSAAAIGLMGLGAVNSVFEDDVMLSNIPVFDSLLNVLNGGLIVPSDIGSITSNISQGKGNSTDDGDDFDITTLAYAEYCYTKTPAAGNSTQTNNTLAIDITHTGHVGSLENNSDNLNNNATTSLDANEDKSVVINAFPNPFRDFITINIEGASYQDIIVEVLDVAGRMVRTVQVQEQNQIVLHRENLSPGIYIYRLAGDGALVHTGKIVVQ